MDSIYGYTTNLRLIKSRYDADTWHDNEYDNLDTIDALLGSFLSVSQFRGDWQLDTAYSVEDTFIADSKLWIVDQEFTSPSTGTFADWYAEHTDYVQTWNGTTKAREWAVKMSGTVNEGGTSDYSSKAYAISEDLIPEGSAKEWSLKAKVYYDDVSDMYDVLVANPNIALLADHLEEVEIAADNITSINTVASNTTNIDTVANNSSDISTVSGMATSVNTVATNISSINAVSLSISDITDVASHLSDIQAAEGYAEEAKDWATKMDGMVDGDYSAKYYANNARTIVEEIGSSRHLGEIVKSLVPLYDTSLHLLDGSVIEDTDLYHDFIEFIAGLSSSNPSLFLTEAAWQTQVTTYGTCGKFVWNSTNRTVRLPKMVGFEESTITLSQVGDYTQAGLPNIQGTITIAGSHGSVYSGSGAFYTEGTTTYGEWGNDGVAPASVKMRASNSNAIYGRSSTVQPASIKELVYMVLSSRASEGGIMITATNNTDYDISIGEKVCIGRFFDNYDQESESYEINSLYELMQWCPDIWTGTALENISSSGSGKVQIQGSKFPMVTVTVETVPSDATVEIEFMNRFIGADYFRFVKNGNTVNVATYSDVTINVSADGYQSVTEEITTGTTDETITIELQEVTPLLAVSSFKGNSGGTTTKYYTSAPDIIDWQEGTLPLGLLYIDTTDYANNGFVYGNGKWISPSLTGGKYAISTDCENWTVYNSPLENATTYNEPLFLFANGAFYCWCRTRESVGGDDSIYMSEDGIDWYAMESNPEGQWSGTDRKIFYANSKFFLTTGRGVIYATEDFNSFDTISYASGYGDQTMNVIFFNDRYYFMTFSSSLYSQVRNMDDSYTMGSAFTIGGTSTTFRQLINADTAIVALDISSQVSNSKALYVSSNGTNWTEKQFPSAINNVNGIVYYDGTIFITYDDNGQTKTITTTDLGDNWTTEQSTFNSLNGAGWNAWSAMSLGYTVQGD